MPDRAYFSRRELKTFEPTAVLVAEILSPDDETYAKFGFYFDRGVVELLIVDPDRRAIEWYTRGTDACVRVDGSTVLELTEAELTAEIDWPV